MKREMNEMDELFKRDLPSASREVVEADGARVLDRLRTHRHELPKLNVELELGRAPIRNWRLGFIGVAAAAAIVVAMLLRIPGAPAVLEDVAGSRNIEFGEVLRSGGVPAGTLVLADSSRVEMRANAELWLERAQDGVRIHLGKGSVLVTAAKQHNGHLYVQTKDVIVSVIGTVFLVNAEEEGSRVAVIEGEVRVQQGTIETNLRRGEKLATNPNMEMLQLASLQQGPQRTMPASAVPPPTGIVGYYIAELPLPPGGPEPPDPPQPQPRPEAPSNAVRPGEIPKWDAVSIRQCLPATGGVGRGGGGGGGGPAPAGPFRFSSDRMTLNCMTVRSLIRSAYRVYADPGRPGSAPMDDVLIRGIAGGRGRRPTDGTDGGPEWVDNDLYTIEAKAEVVTDRALMQGPMLQAILEDRFKIKVHKETREVAVDALVQAKGGSKLKPFVEGSCVRRPPRPPGLDSISRPRVPQTVNLHIKADAAGRLSGTLWTLDQSVDLADVRVEGQSLSFSVSDGNGWKGSIENNGARLNGVMTGRGAMPLVFTRETALTASQRYCRIEGGGLNLNTNPKPVNKVYHAEGVTIDEFAKMFLDGFRGRFVIDRTGLTGKFDFHLEEEIAAEFRQRFPELADVWGPSTAPPLPEALEKQLGLKLESGKGLVEFLVIGHIDRPSPN